MVLAIFVGRIDAKLHRIAPTESEHTNTILKSDELILSSVHGYSPSVERTVAWVADGAATYAAPTWRRSSSSCCARQD